MPQFEHLFRPIQIGPMAVPNRICFSAHGNLFADAEGLPTEQEIHFYGERARGGAGLIVIGGSFLKPSSFWLPGVHLVNDDRAIPGYRRIADAVHEHGTKILSQIDHFGREMANSYSHLPIVAPSALHGWDRGADSAAKELEVEEIENLVEQAGHGARVIREGGLDGVELQGWCYLVSQFLSPLSNQRTDQYGGSLENRLRFPLDLLRRIRHEVGADRVVGIKLVGDEFAPGGLTLDDAREIAKALVAAGTVDYIHVSGGSFYSMPTVVPEMSYPSGFETHLAAGVREVVNVPVIAVKRINDPVLAEKVLADGRADMVAMARALIADAELPRKAREGRVEDIRQCTGVNQECIGRVMKGFAMGCIQNPAVGEEKRWGVGTIAAAQRKKKVVVVGGGPGGLKAAELAAERGHEVHLYEKGQELGGQVLWITKVGSRREFESIVRYLRIRLQKLGVKMHLGREMTAQAVLDEGADAVVVATGSTPLRSGYTSLRPHVPSMPGAEQQNVFTVREVYEDGKAIGERVVLIDEFGEMEATMTAEYLASDGRRVEIVTRLPHVGMKIEEFSYDPQMERLAERKVAMTSFTAVTAIDGKRVTGEHVYSLAPWEREADSVVLVMGKLPNDELYFALKNKVPALRRVGDCVAPRKITEAIYEGNIVGREI